MRNKTALAQPHCAPCMMAAGVVRAAIASILLDKDFELNTPRMVVAKETAQMLLDVSTGDDMGQDRFDHTQYLLILLLKPYCQSPTIVAEKQE